MDTLTHHTLDETYIQGLFQHPTFQNKLQKVIKESTSYNNYQNLCTDQEQLSGIADEISLLIYQNQEKSLSTISRELKKQISDVYGEIEKLRDSFTFQFSKIEYPIKQMEDECNLEDEHFLDFPSIKRTLHDLSEKVKELSQTSSVLLDSTQCSKDQKNSKEDTYQEKIIATVTQMEQSMVYQRENFEKSINKMLEKQQKTINSILETLNDLHEPPLSEKTSNFLTSSKSTTKLKSFFGFR